MSVMAALELNQGPRGTHLNVRAQPNARRTGILGERAGAVRVGVAVAPENGKANAAIASVLAEALACRPSQVLLVSGPSNRSKRFLIFDLNPETIRERLDQATLKPN